MSEEKTERLVDLDKWDALVKKGVGFRSGPVAIGLECAQTGRCVAEYFPRTGALYTTVLRPPRDGEDPATKRRTKDILAEHSQRSVIGIACERYYLQKTTECVEASGLPADLIVTDCNHPEYIAAFRKAVETEKLRPGPNSLLRQGIFFSTVRRDGAGNVVADTIGLRPALHREKHTFYAAILAVGLGELAPDGVVYADKAPEFDYMAHMESATEAHNTDLSITSLNNLFAAVHDFARYYYKDGRFDGEEFESGVRVVIESAKSCNRNPGSSHPASKQAEAVK